MIDDSGNCRPSGLAAGAAGVGETPGCALYCGAAADDVVRGETVTDMGRAGATFVAPSSKRRSSPRSNPTNLVFTMFNIAGLAITVFCKINKRFRYKAGILPRRVEIACIGAAFAQVSLKMEILFHHRTALSAVCSVVVNRRQ
jgi:hypothetical protein